MARQEEYARLIVLESGKALAEARGEVAYAAEFLRIPAQEFGGVGHLATRLGQRLAAFEHDQTGILLLLSLIHI